MKQMLENKGNGISYKLHTVTGNNTGPAYETRDQVTVQLSSSK